MPGAGRGESLGGLLKFTGEGGIRQQGSGSTMVQPLGRGGQDGGGRGMQGRPAGRPEVLVNGGAEDRQRELQPRFRSGRADAKQAGSVRGVHGSHDVGDAGQLRGQGKR